MAPPSAAGGAQSAGGGVVTTANSYCIALHQYPSSKSDELSLVPGDVIQVLKKADDGWWYGRKVQPAEDKAGWFPSNFNYEPENIDLKKQGITYARVDFEYKAQEEDELELAVGDIITVINTEEDDGWHRGILNGRVGLFPANFVKMMTKAELDRDKRSVKKVAPGLSPSERRISLMPSKYQEMQQQEKASAIAAQASPKQSPAKEPKIMCRALVTFEYVAQQPDELNLTKGMKIDVIGKDDEGWWTGIDPSGRTGVFPYNFVSEIPVEDKIAPTGSTASTASADRSPGQSKSKPSINLKTKPGSSSSRRNDTAASSPATEVARSPPPIKAAKPSGSKVTEVIQAMNNKPIMKVGSATGLNREASQSNHSLNGDAGGGRKDKLSLSDESASTNAGADSPPKSPLNHVTRDRVTEPASGRRRRPPSQYIDPRNQPADLVPQSDSEATDPDDGISPLSPPPPEPAHMGQRSGASTSNHSLNRATGPASPEEFSPPPQTPQYATKHQAPGGKSGSSVDTAVEIGQLRDELHQWMHDERKSREAMAHELAYIRKAVDRLLHAEKSRR